MSTMIEVIDLRKSFKQTTVLEGISFSVDKGAIFAMLGANGAGKTTTVNILTTLLSADGGTAHVAGFDVARQPHLVRRNISLTGQFAAVDEVLTARENLVLIAELRHAPRPRVVADTLLEQFGLTDAADRRVATFSGGMQRRLDIAMSLIGDPPVVFLDEPTTGLDPQSRTGMWETVRGLADRGVTIFLTTQYLEEADRLADHIAILSHGTIVAEGTPRELKQLLPHGRVELRFASRDKVDEAQRLLARHDVLRNDTDLSLTVATDGSVGEVARLLSYIESANLEPTEFAQKTPTLDDAFLQIVTAAEVAK